MKNCPFCGGQLPDDASFCIYCMKELNEKERVRTLGARRWKKRLGRAALILAGVALVSGAGVWLGIKAWPSEKAVQTDETATADDAPVTTEPETAETEPDEPETTFNPVTEEKGNATAVRLAPDPNDPRTQVYATVATFQKSYNYEIARTQFVDALYWSPWDLTLDRTENGWACYSCPGGFQNEKPRIYFKLDGTAVLVALNAVCDGEDEKVRSVAEHLSMFMYTGQVGEMNQNALTEFLYPSPAAGFIPDESVPIQMALSDYSLIERLGIVKTGEDHFKNDTTDPARCACFYRTVSFWQFMEQNRFFEFHRQRYKGGETLHDYFFYFTFGEAEIP